MNMRTLLLSFGLVTVLLGTQTVQAWSLKSDAPKRSITNVTKKASKSFFKSKNLGYIAAAIAGVACAGLVYTIRNRPVFNNLDDEHNTNDSNLLQFQGKSRVDELKKRPMDEVVTLDDSENQASTVSTPGAIVEEESNDGDKQLAINDEPLPVAVEPTLPSWQQALYQTKGATSSLKVILEYLDQGDSFGVRGNISKNLFPFYCKELELATKRPEQYQFSLNKTDDEPGLLKAYVALRMMIPAENISHFMKQLLQLDVTDGQIAGFRNDMKNPEILKPIWQQLFEQKNKNMIKPNPDLKQTIAQLNNLNGNKASSSRMHHPDGTPIVLKKINRKPTSYADSLSVEGGYRSPLKQFIKQFTHKPLPEGKRVDSE